MNPQCSAYPWTAVVCTCPTSDGAFCIKQELLLLQKKGVIHEETILLTVEDPERCFGSGGVTLNALLVAAEYLSAKKKFNVLNVDLLLESHILIIHNGRSCPFEICGKAFISLPPTRGTSITSSCELLSTNFEHLLDIVQNIAKNQKDLRGVWVCSTDMLLAGQLPPVLKLPPEDCVLFSALGTPEYGTKHGVLKLNCGNDGVNRVADILYCHPLDDVKSVTWKDGKVPLICGIVYLSPALTETLVALHAQSPINSCTYLGLDSGGDALQVSLFFDILAAMIEDLSEHSFLAGACGKTYALRNAYREINNPLTRHIRSVVWKSLRRFRIAAVVLEGMEYLYLSEKQPLSDQLSVLKTFIQKQSSTAFGSNDCTSVNSLLHGVTPASSSFVQNSILKGSVKWPLVLNENASVSGAILDTASLGRAITIPGDIFYAAMRTTSSKDENVLNTGTTSGVVHVLVGLSDHLYAPFTDQSSTICNVSWETFFQRTGISSEEIWSDDLEMGQKCLANAKLFPENGNLLDVYWWFEVENDKRQAAKMRWQMLPRTSIDRVLHMANLKMEFSHKRDVFAKLALPNICRILSDGGEGSLVPVFHVAAVEGWAQAVLDGLDDLAMNCDYERWEPGLAARILSNIANLLGCVACGEGGLRSGPSSNKEWVSAFSIFEKNSPGSIHDGVVKLREIRQNWIGVPHRLIRAARHYEGAAQILIRHAVFTAKSFITTKLGCMPDIGVWVKCECPARVDLFGGWTDTPPICYELGGSVVNAAVRVNGRRPIGADVCRIPEAVIVIVLDNDLRLTLTDIEDLSDYNQPSSFGSLAKACMVFTNIIDLESANPLGDQLLKKFGSGFELHTWSRLPKGSGLGTSSIMAGAILAALWVASGIVCDKSSLIHAVLCVEQMLTTGGGWQDQVGGLIGGVVHGKCQPELPLKVEVVRLDLRQGLIAKLQCHLALIYTGKIRLAKNLLQNVLRNWYARDENVLNTFKQLYQNSFAFVEAIKKGDLERVGNLLNHYWTLKKTLAPGAEPVMVQNIMHDLETHISGQILCGAGGGGFLIALLRNPNDHIVLKNVISETKVPGVCMYDFEIDQEGIMITVDDHVVKL